MAQIIPNVHTDVYADLQIKRSRERSCGKSCVDIVHLDCLKSLQGIPEIQFVKDMDDKLFNVLINFVGSGGRAVERRTVH